MLDLVPWEPHLEVWLLIIGAVAIGGFAVRVVQPKAIELGHERVTVAQRACFVAAVLLMWFVSDWPVHEIAEEHLYFVHMAQHLFLSMIIPALFVLSIPEWFLTIVFDQGKKPWSVLKWLARPVQAAAVFSALTMILHWTWVVQKSYESGAVHFLFHALIFSSGLLLWAPVIGPVVQWRLNPLGQCLYLFAVSVVPTIPGGWLVFAEQPVYRHYDVPQRLWGIDVVVDQQAAGLIMKLVGGFFLWGVIVAIFFKWSAIQMRNDERDSLAPSE